jgi:hypothetical protein
MSFLHTCKETRNAPNMLILLHQLYIIININVPNFCNKDMHLHLALAMHNPKRIPIQLIVILELDYAFFIIKNYFLKFFKLFTNSSLLVFQTEFLFYFSLVRNSLFPYDSFS